MCENLPYKIHYFEHYLLLWRTILLQHIPSLNDFMFLHTLSFEHSIKTDRACDKNQSISYILPFYLVFHYSCLGTLDCCQVLMTVHSNFSNVYIFFLFKFLLKNHFYSKKYTRNMIVVNKYSEY